MTIEIITIGDEILIGQITDTNSSWMADQLTIHGHQVVAITSVADIMDDITYAINIAFSRASIVLITGGIGPTKDDITKATLTQFFNTHLIFNDSVFQNIQQVLSHRSIIINKLTKGQAMVPKSAQIIQNHVGTAPILWFDNNSKILVSMPGVPFEMKNAMTNEIIPRLSAISNGDTFQSNTLLVSGISESDLAILLSRFEESLPPNTTLAYLPSYGLIRLRISIRNSANSLLIDNLTLQLKALIEPYIIDDIDRPIENLLYQLLKIKDLTLSIAESCTGGNISHRITLISGISSYFKGSVVSYSNDSKVNQLGVNKNHLKLHGAVSQQVVEEMAQGCATLFDTHCSISVSGIAGPDGGSPHKPVGTTWICTYYNGKKLSKLYKLGTSRPENIERATNMALIQMIRMIRHE